MEWICKNDGEKYQQIIQEKNRQTTITYENEEIVSKEEEELEEYDNIYLKLKQSKKLRESTTTITNHAVVIADVEKDNATIILDPTNGTNRKWRKHESRIYQKF